MLKFRLIGSTTVFTVVRFYLAAGFIPSVVGMTPDGRYQTHARTVDVVPLAS